MVRFGDKTNNRGNRHLEPGITPHQPPQPDHDQQAPPPKRRVPKWLIVAAVVTAACIAVPATIAARWFVKATIEAGKGEESPSLAVMAYFYDTPLGGALAGDEIEYNLFCDGKDEQLHQQTLQLVTAAKRADIAGKKAFDRVEEHPTAGNTTIDGDRATVATQAQWNYSNIDRSRAPGSWMWWGSNYQPWTFKLVNDNGWRICEVTAPGPCAPDSGIACDWKPQPSPTPSVTRTWDSRVPYRCLPDKPYHDLEKGCAAPPPDWTQPGPYYCAPDQPFGIPNTRKEECASLGWL